MHVLDRAYGIETEYGCVLKQGGTVLGMMEWPCGFLRGHLYQNADRTQCAINSNKRMWSVNGSLTYIDTGDHPEHSTPEARRIRDAVIWCRAGDELMSELFGCNNTDDWQVLLFKNNVAYDEHGALRTFGCHENYLGYGSEATYNTDALTPFLITRQIMCGNGSWDARGIFFHSQRARVFVSTTGAFHARIAVKVKMSPQVRVHLTYGDSNMLDWATFLKLGTTSLVLSCMEADRMPDTRFAMSPLRDFERVSCGDAHDPVLWTESRGKISALETQVIYWEFVRECLRDATFASPELEAEVQLVMIMWEQTLNAIARCDMAWMLGRLDWATKRWLIEREIKRAAVGSDISAIRDIRASVDLAYHAIMRGSLRERIHARWPERMLGTEEEIRHAMKYAPKGTRAQLRAAAIRTSVECYRQNDISVDWHTINFMSDQGAHPYYLHDALEEYARLIPSVQASLRLPRWFEPVDTSD